MMINITNNTMYRNINLCYNGMYYNLSKNRVINIATNNINKARLLIEIKDKDNVYPDFIDLFCGILNPENTTCIIKCSYICEVESNLEYCNIIISDLFSNNEVGIVYRSVIINSENAIIKTIDYKLGDIQATKKRYVKLHLFLLSSLPLILLLLLLCIIDFSWSLIGVILLDVFLFVIPSIRKIKWFNRECNEMNARTILLNSEIKQRTGR